MGHDVAGALELLGGKIYHVHLKDTTRADGVCHALGEGDTGCDEIIKTLYKRGFDGIISIEIEADGDPDEAVKNSYEFVRGCISGCV